MLLLSLQCWEVADTVLWSRRRTEASVQEKLRWLLFLVEDQRDRDA